MNKGEILIGFGLGLLLMAFVCLREPRLNPDRCTTNCIGTTIAFDLTERGEAAAARSFTPELFDCVIRTEIYPEADEYIIGTGYNRIRRWLYQRGGNRGYLRYTRAGRDSHMVAYVREHGIVWIVDAQVSRLRIPLWLYYVCDRGETYKAARLDNIDYCDCELLNKIIERK